MAATGLSRKIALWLYDNKFSHDGRDRDNHRRYTDEDI